MLKSKARFGEARKTNYAPVLLFALTLLVSIGYGAAATMTNSWAIGIDKYLK